MQIRKAQEKDIDRINDLLYQVCMIHHNGRPDIFKAGARKYTDRQLVAILNDERTPVLAAVDDNDLAQHLTDHDLDVLVADLDTL